MLVFYVQPSVSHPAVLEPARLDEARLDETRQGKENREKFPYLASLAIFLIPTNILSISLKTTPKRQVVAG